MLLNSYNCFDKICNVVGNTFRKLFRYGNGKIRVSIALLILILMFVYPFLNY